MANPAGVDPATSALTRRRSAVELRIHAGDREGPPWSGRWDSNPRSLAPKASALPLGYVQVAPERLVEVTGLEPAADCMQSSCTTVVLHPQVVPHEACAARGTCSAARLQARQLGTVPSTRVPVHGQVHVPGTPRYLGGAVSRRWSGRSGGRTRTRGEPAARLRTGCRRRSAGPSIARSPGPFSLLRLAAPYPCPDSNREPPGFEPDASASWTTGAWCPRPDSNRDARVEHEHLKLARLPVPPRGQCGPEHRRAVRLLGPGAARRSRTGHLRRTRSVLCQVS
jgi:hypothetical protein